MKKVNNILLCFLLVISFLCSTTIISQAAGNRGYCDYYGFTYESYISYLKSHENDKYYLTTPYHNSDWRSPNGDTSFNGTAGMNCNGFVWHVLQSVIKINGGNPKNYDIQNFSNYKGWMRILQDNNIKYYIFNNKTEALKSGVMAKGDIIYMFESSSLTPSKNNHTGIYWGDGSTDVFWHSAGKCNQISKIWSGGSVVKFVVAKMCVNGSITVNSNDVSGNRLNGNKYTIYNSKGSVYKTVNGNSTLKSVPFGTYTVKQTSTVSGYTAVTSTQKVTVSKNSPNQSVNFKSKKGLGGVSIKVRRGQYFPSVKKYKYYDISGFKLNVYSDINCNNLLDTVITDGNGIAYYGCDNKTYSLEHGKTYYFRPQENQSDFDNFDYDSTKVYTVTVNAAKTTQCNEICTLLKKGSIGMSGFEENTEFILLSNQNMNSCVNTYNSDGDGNTVFDCYAYTDTNGIGFIGFNNNLSNEKCYSLSEGIFYVRNCDTGETKKINVYSGCITDFTTQKAQPATVYGDVDFSGVVTAADARLSLRFAAKLDDFTIEEINRIDLNHNGKADVKDSRIILRYTAKLENELSVKT